MPQPVDILWRALRRALADDVPLLASAVAYSAFFAIPSVLLVGLGTLTLALDRSTIASLVGELGRIAPGEVVTLLRSSLERLDAQPGAGLLLTAVGLGLALWSATGATSTAMSAMSRAYERPDDRGFVRKRVLALLLTAVLGSAALLVVGCLVLGPPLSRWLGSATGEERIVSWAWWAGQWPILACALVAAFSVMLSVGPAGGQRDLRTVMPGAIFTAVCWLAASGAFALYTSSFGSYNKAWGSLSAVIVTLTWLWLSGLALLLGAELNAELERTRAAPTAEEVTRVDPPAA